MSACKDFKELDERTSGTGKKVAGGKKKRNSCLKMECSMQQVPWRAKVFLNQDHEAAYMSTSPVTARKY